MYDEKEPIMCEKCNVAMVQTMRDEPIDREPITTTTTSTGVSAIPGDYENSDGLSEWIEYKCPECFNTKAVKSSS